MRISKYARNTWAMAVKFSRESQHGGSGGYPPQFVLGLTDVSVSGANVRSEAWPDCN